MAKTNLKKNNSEFFISNDFLINDENKLILSGELKSAFNKLDSIFSISNKKKGDSYQEKLNKSTYFNLKNFFLSQNILNLERISKSQLLKTHSPFLDYILIEFSKKIPVSLKKETKNRRSILSETMMSLIGKQLCQSYMQTFPLFSNNLCSYRHNLSSEILFDGRFESRNLFSINNVKQPIDLDLSNQYNYSHNIIINRIIALEIWYRLFIDKDFQLLSD